MRRLLCPSNILEEGADSRIRTDDLIITNDLLYQLSYIGTLSLRRFQEQDSSTRELKNPGMRKTALDRGFFPSARVLEFLSTSRRH